MVERSEPRRDEKGLSARHLVSVFLLVVAVCAFFFSLGFLVGYNERPSRAASTIEHVTPPPVIPETVNPPHATSQPAAKAPAGTSTSAAAPAATSSGALLEPAQKPESRATSATAARPEPAPAPTSPKSGPAAQAVPQSPSPSAGSSGEVGTGVTIQVAAVRAKKDAEGLVEILKKRGYPVFLVTPEYAHANDNLFRVHVGPFSSRDDAEKVRAKLSQEGFKDLFIRR